jgi:hypothetical protein
MVDHAARIEFRSRRTLFRRLPQRLDAVAQRTLCETARRSEDRLQEHAAVRDERHEEAQYGAKDDGRDLAVLGMHPDEHEALDRQDRGGHHGERRLPVEGGGDDQPDRADEFED